MNSHEEPARSRAEGVNDPAAEGLHPQRSVTEGIGDLFEDGRTYLEAEIAYQKSRAALIASKGKRGTVLALASFAFLNSALIALVVGLVITLAPHLTPLGATVTVVGMLLFGAIACALMARARFRRLTQVFDGERE